MNMLQRVEQQRIQQQRYSRAQVGVGLLYQAVRAGTAISLEADDVAHKAA